MSVRRVDEIPLVLRPLFLLFGWSLGLLFYALVRGLGATARVRLEGTPLPVEGPAIYCIWHEDLVPYFAVFSRVRRQTWMNHPAWHMKPVHVLLRLTGVERICLGSSGHDGKAALAGVVAALREGDSTTVASDGPAGPARVLKPGVLAMSRDAGVPIYPIRFQCSRAARLRGWDRKKVPWPGSEILVHVGEPVRVEPGAETEAAARLTREIGGEAACEVARPRSDAEGA